MKNTLIIISTVFCITLQAQDQLYKKDNSKLEVRILEVGTKDIKYKLFNNPDGPTYIESRQNVNVIIYENGQHEVIGQTPTLPAEEPVPAGNNRRFVPVLETYDSLTYYRYNHNISLNFLTILNNEVGLIYQREFFRSQFNIIVPLAFGLERPGITENVYFQNGSYNGRYSLRRKMYEVGFGIHYYPSLRTNVNYFIGPVFRYLKYDGTQMYYNPTSVWPFSGIVSTKNTSLSRYCMTITNGFVIRTRSRLTATIFGSLGFKKDVIDDPIVDPVSGAKISGIQMPVSLYFWTGLNVGFNF